GQLVVHTHGGHTEQVPHHGVVLPIQDPRDLRRGGNPRDARARWSKVSRRTRAARAGDTRGSWAGATTTKNAGSASAARGTPHRGAAVVGVLAAGGERVCECTCGD